MKIRADIPVILYTGFSEQITEGRAKELGIKEFILKPIVMNTLAETVRSVPVIPAAAERRAGMTALQIMR